MRIRVPISVSLSLSGAPAGVTSLELDFFGFGKLESLIQCRRRVTGGHTTTALYRAVMSRNVVLMFSF